MHLRAKALLGLLPLLLLLASPAEARNRWRGPCVAGQKLPVCHFWKARIATMRGGRPIAGIADGDTIRVKIVGGGGAPESVRILGINAMELYRYSNIPSRRRGACHAIEATSLIERYIDRAHRTVRLGAQDPRSRTGKRLYRSVAVRRGGRWLDLGRAELRAGLALWLPHGREYAHNGEYHRLAEKAAAAQRGLYDPDYCGPGPAQDANLRLSINWDADGNDSANLNGEWVRIRNLGGVALPIGGWWLRDSWLRYGGGHVPGFRFPASTSIPAGGAITLHVGCGANGGSTFHWCQHGSAFENATDGARQVGDGGYLFDPQGDLRFSSIYPCAVGCSDPLRGSARLTVHPSAPEYFEIRNAGAAPIDLQDHLLKVSLSSNPSLFTRSYDFDRSARLEPGEALRVWVKGSPADDDRLDRHWGLSDYILPDRGGRASLRSFTDVVVDCDGWGGFSC